MFKPGSPEWYARKEALLLAESLEPLAWFYLSFAGEEGFRGGVFVEAHGPTSAIQRAHEMGINPGGEVATMGPLNAALLAATVPPKKRNRLLTREEVENP